MDCVCSTHNNSLSSDIIPILEMNNNNKTEVQNLFNLSDHP